MIEELKVRDKYFNEEMFITKVNNIFIMLCTAIMNDDLDRVRHFISDRVESICEIKLNNLNDNNLKQIYGELNVKNSEISSVTIVDECARIEVILTSRFLDYRIDKTSSKKVSGNDIDRIEKKYALIFTKQLSAHYSSVITKCTFCGADLEVNNSGICPYCRGIFKAENYDWILNDIKEI